MAVIPNLNDVLQFSTVCRNLSQNGVVTLHYKVTNVGGAGITDAQIADILDATVAPLLRAYMPATAAYAGSRTQLIFPAPVHVAQIVTSRAGNGLVATDPLHSVTSLLVSKRTTLAGRANRGRSYLPFWGESQNDVNGAPTAGAQTLANNWATAMLVPIVAAVGGNSITLQPVIYHRVSHGTENLTGWIIRSQWATQRRRSEINRGDQLAP